MATKARYLKTPLQNWIADSRKQGGYTSMDLASWTGVSEDTARGWESRGRPSEEALGILERKFGKPRPADDAAPAGGEALVQAIAAQTAAISDLVSLLRPLVASTLDSHQARLDEIDAVLRGLAAPAMTGEAEQPSRDRTAG